MKAYGKKVTLKRIKKAFKESNFQCIFSNWWENEKRCCPIAILIVTKTGSIDLIKRVQSKSPTAALQVISTEIGESVEIISSFVSGFDDTDAIIDDKEAYKLGCQIRKDLTVN